MKLRWPRAADLVGRRDALVGGRRLGALVPLHFSRAAREGAEPLAALVVRDLEEPVARQLGALTTLEGSVGVQECRLSGVLGVRRIPKDGEHVPVHVMHMTAIEPFEGPLSEGP